MATLDYQLGTPLGPDSRALADLQAIDDYVRTVCRPKVAKYPKSQPLVEDYERWRQGVGYVDMMVMVNDTMRAAKAKRDGINQAQGSFFSPGSVVEEGAFVTSPPDSSVGGRLAGVVAIAGLGAVGGAWAVWKVLSHKVRP